MEASRLTPAIEIAGLRKVYRSQGVERTALDGLDLCVEPGTVFGFVGPNGAGKSTTIKILVGLVRATSGSAAIFGEPCGTLASRRKLGFLPETAVYHEFLTGREVVELHAGLAGVPAADRRTRSREALELVGLAERAESRVSELSKGMKQRLGIAQAVVGDPPLLILDELTSGLDPVAQAELKWILLRLKDQGKTIFFSSHQLVEVEAVADVVGILHGGRLRRCAPTAELLERTDRTALDASFPGGPPERLGERGWSVDRHGALARVVAPTAELEAALQAVRDSGGTVLSVASAGRSLEAVFFDTVGEGVPR